MKKDLPHPLLMADALSSNSWIKWAKKQQKADKP
jgi:hypothetical protein